MEKASVWSEIQKAKDSVTLEIWSDTLAVLTVTEWGVYLIVVLFLPHLVELVGVLSDKGSVEDLTIRHADHNQLRNIRKTSPQAVMTLKEEGRRKRNRM